MSSEKTREQKLRAWLHDVAVIAGDSNTKKLVDLIIVYVSYHGIPRQLCQVVDDLPIAEKPQSKHSDYILDALRICISAISQLQAQWEITTGYAANKNVMVNVVAAKNLAIIALENK